jgi:NAD(P)-dependent dehydrogenase (short-subunit alcohol dehydrogenase family)
MPKTLMVIGAGPGIGLETARRFIKEGYDVILEPPRVYRRPFRLSHAATAGSSSIA